MLSVLSNADKNDEIFLTIRRDRLSCKEVLCRCHAQHTWVSSIYSDAPGVTRPRRVVNSTLSAYREYALIVSG